MYKFIKFQAKANIPGVSERTLRRDFEKTGITLDAKIQVYKINVHVLCIYRFYTYTVHSCTYRSVY